MFKMKYLLLAALMLLSLPALWAQDSASRQNLVYNGSFEECMACPRRVDALGILTLVEGWYQPTLGSADYFSTCGSRECGVPKNKLGEQSPLDGNAYCGIYCSKTDYREYLQTQLRRRLKAGDSVRLTYYVSLSEESTGAISTMGGLFTADRISDTVRSIFLRKENASLLPGVSQTVARPFAPQVVHPADSLLGSTKEWQRVSGTFVAQGGERFLTIGNFYPLERSGYGEEDSLTNLLPGAYYYIDNVSVECLNCKPEEDEADQVKSYLAKGQAEYKAGNTFVLKDIYFEFDKTTLLQQSFFELQKLLAILKAYPRMRIEIGGHTDAKGSDSYNNKLSEGRAKAVVDYLISKGVEPKRLKSQGYGKSRPIDNNDTEEGRANNRRVEFKILTMR